MSTVTITVVAGDPTRNSPPNTPVAVTARVFTHGSSTISVPLAGIDPDGDWVVLQSLEQPEAPLGETAVSGADTLSYKAFDKPGVDRIRYLATDPAGLTVTGVITVLVAEPGDSARPPVAPDLTVAVRPGASIRIDPLSVVIDPGGQQVLLATPAFVAPAELSVVVDEQSLILTAPAAADGGQHAVHRGQQEGADGVRLGEGHGVRRTPRCRRRPPRMSSSGPPIWPPNNQTVDVDVSGSITNRSGRRDALTVSVDPLSTGQASKVAPQLIRVTVAAVRQIVAYQVTDAYGSSVTAFIVVPPQQQLVGPQLIAGMGPIPLDAGQSTDVLISDYVTVGGGGAPSIAATPALRSTQGTAVRNSADLADPVRAVECRWAGRAVRADRGRRRLGGGADARRCRSNRGWCRRRNWTRRSCRSRPAPSGSVDLAALTSTADEEQQNSISYAVGAGPDGIQTDQGRQRRHRDGPAGRAARAPPCRLPIQVVDGDGRDGKAVLTVTVTGSRQPLATVVDQQIAQGRAGVEVAADMLTGSFDPIGLGLTVTKVSVTEGVGGIAAGPVLDRVDGAADAGRRVCRGHRGGRRRSPTAPRIPSGW